MVIYIKSATDADLRSYIQALSGCEEFAFFVMFTYCQNILVSDLQMH